MTHQNCTTTATTVFNLQERFAALQERLTAAAAVPGAPLSLHLEPDIPDQLAGDAELLERTVSRLLEQLGSRAGQGEIQLQASEISREADDLELCFSISSPVHDEPFLQATLDMLSGELTGLGGEGFFECIPGKGSITQFTARFRVPVPAAPEAPATLSILLVDDVPINLELGKIVMEKQGHRVTTATNGAEAFETYREGQFDMIFMDIQMPVMDGFQATRAIREAEQSRGGRHIPIIAMTAYATIGDRSRCLEAGMDSYISKPVRPAEIVEVIRQFAVSQTLPDVAAGAAAAAAVPQAEPAVFDRAELLDRLGGREELIPRFTAMFRESVTTALQQLDEAIAGGNGDTIHRQAHTIKGASANIGAERMRACAQLLDEAAKQNELDGIPPLRDRLKQEFTHFCKEVLS